MFLLLVIYSLGVFWSAFFPRRSWVEGTRFEWLGPTLHFINPGTFKLKEVRFASSHLSALLTPNAARHRKRRCFECVLGQHRRPQFLRAASKCSLEFSATAFNIKPCGLQLFYNTKVDASTAVLATFSTAVFGYGIVGLLRPLTVYPSEMVYWAVSMAPIHCYRIYLLSS